MFKVKYILYAVLLLCLTCLNSIAVGQVLIPGDPKPVSIYTLPYFQSWDLGEDKITQFGLPVFVHVRPIENLSLWFNDSAAFSNLSRNADDSSNLGGVSDTKLKISYSMFDKKFLATFGINFPIANTELDQDQFEAAKAIYDEALGFRINKMGGGLDINSGIAFAANTGPIGLSLAAGYLLRGSYKTMKGADYEYKPGDELSVTATMDFVRNMLSLNGSLAYTNYGNDEMDSEGRFKQGDEIKGRALIGYKAEPIAITISIVDAIRMKNQVFSEEGNLVTEESNSHGNSLDTFIITQYIINRHFSIIPLAGLTFLSENGYGENSAFIWSAGVGLQFLPNTNSSININGRILKGDIRKNNASGFDMGISAILKF